MTHDGRGFGCSVGEGEERLQTEWAPHHVGNGCGHWVSFGILPEDTASHRAGQSESSPLTQCDVMQAEDGVWETIFSPCSQDQSTINKMFTVKFLNLDSHTIMTCLEDRKNT